MSRTYRVWYALILLVALAPAALRMLAWRNAAPPEVDLEMAREGRVLFNHDWRPKDPLCPEGDGLGPLYNATSCAACAMLLVRARLPACQWAKREPNWVRIDPASMRSAAAAHRSVWATT